MFDADLRLPEGGVLLHIGPHKTGTTAIQGAMRQARPEMAEHGVVYAGNVRQHQMAALAVTAGKGLQGDRPADEKDWRTLVRQVKAAAGSKVVVSSEFFDGADDECAQRIVDELGGERVHVVVTLRPLAKILPSAWQQYVRNRLRWPYDEWLDAMFNQPPYVKPTETFWQRHHHDVIVERWAKVVGPERLLVIVVDESDPHSLMRTFERITGLPDQLLAPEQGWTNRSLTAAETELVRQLNIEFHKRKWPAKLYHETVRRGAVRRLQHVPVPDGAPSIVTPRWAIERANQTAAAAADRIAASGVWVLGDLSALSAVPSEPPAEVESPQAAAIPADSAAAAIVGVIKATLEKYEDTNQPSPVDLGSDNFVQRIRRRAHALPFVRSPS